MDFNHPDLSVRRQCELLSLSPSSLYYECMGESEMNLTLMNEIDEIYTKFPFFGSRKMIIKLGERGFLVNRKRVQRLMRTMGIEAVYCKPKTSRSHPEHKKYPYLLRGLTIYRPNQVWAADITYVRISSGFLYLVAIIDWFSRYVLTWKLSNSLDSSFCVSALEEALSKYTWPQIFNTDQGVQFTDSDFIDTLTDTKYIKVSMDGKGRFLDNIFIERLWRSYKYEDVYLKSYQDRKDATYHTDNYMQLFNQERPHENLDYRTPANVYYA